MVLVLVVALVVVLVVVMIRCSSPRSLSITLLEDKVSFVWKRRLETLSRFGTYFLLIPCFSVGCGLVMGWLWVGYVFVMGWLWVDYG